MCPPCTGPLWGSMGVPCHPPDPSQDAATKLSCSPAAEPDVRCTLAWAPRSAVVLAWAPHSAVVRRSGRRLMALSPAAGRAAHPRGRPAGGSGTRPPAGASPVLAVLGGQRPVQLLDDAAGGQRPVDGGEVGGPRGRGQLSSQGRVWALPGCGLAWGEGGTAPASACRGCPDAGAEGVASGPHRLPAPARPACRCRPHAQRRAHSAEHAADQPTAHHHPLL